MTNKLLEGVQYRERKHEFPDWKQSEDSKYHPWKDIPDNGKGMVFASYTQFRVKPEFTYRVNDYGHQSLDDALEAIRNSFDNGSLVGTVEKQELAKVSLSALMEERHIQYSYGANWYDYHKAVEKGLAHRVQFRIRPEYIYTLQFSDGRKTRTFTDKVEMSKAVQLLVDSGDFHFSAIETVKEPTYAW